MTEFYRLLPRGRRCFFEVRSKREEVRGNGRGVFSLLVILSETQCSRRIFFGFFDSVLCTTLRMTESDVGLFDRG